MVCSAARSAAVTGSKAPPPLLSLTSSFSTPRAVRKNGLMASPDTVASSPTNGRHCLRASARAPDARFNGTGHRTAWRRDPVILERRRLAAVSIDTQAGVMVYEYAPGAP
jgi:hypothetical protein